MLKADYAPLTAAYKKMAAQLGVDAINKATLKELPRTLRQTKAQAVKHQESGLSAKGARGRIVTHINRGRGEGVMGVRTNNDVIAAKHFKHKRRGKNVILAGKKGFRQTIANAKWISGKFTKQLLLQTTGVGVKPVRTTQKFDAALRKTYSRVIQPALNGHTTRLMNRLIRGAK